MPYDGSMRRMRRRRIAVVAAAATVTVVLSAGYLIADMADIVPGPLTMRDVRYRSVPSPLTARAAGTIAGSLDDSVAIDPAAAKSLVDMFVATPGVGDDASVVITDARGTIVAEHEADTPREPASTMKTLTALAAASTLDMGSTLDTQTYLIQGDTATLVLKGNGDMLLSAGDDDPEHVNGRAGLNTLAERTAAALAQRGIDHVSLIADDSFFGQDRYPATVADNNPGDLYYTGVSSMAIDGGRQWDVPPADPDTFSAYPTLSTTTVADAAAVFAERLAEQGITVDQSRVVTDSGAVPRNASPIASVGSATLGEILAFAMRHSDNTLAEEFGRLTALALNEDNSPEGGTAAVRAVLERLGVDVTGLTMADCSGLSTGSTVTARTLAAVQVRNLTASGAAAAAEGLSVPGLVGTAANRAVSDDTAGLLRVKTGSLGEVTSMAGNVSRIGGGALAFAVVVNNPDDMAAARDAIDVFVDRLASL